MRFGKWLITVLVALPWVVMAEPVGTVQRVAGDARADGGALASGSTFESGAELTTGDAARLEVAFVDGGRLVLGEHARLKVERYLYDPAANSGEARLKVTDGAFLITSGAVAKLPGRPLSVTTPVATIGVRGTRFWGGPLGNPLDVLVLDGAVTVTNSAGHVDLDAGQGTGVAAVDQVPGAPVKWGDAKIRRALDSVEFR